MEKNKQEKIGQAKIYPLDVSLLSTGEWLSPTMCEEIHGATRKKDLIKYQFETMKLSKRIEELSDQTSRVLVCKCERMGIRVLEDESKPAYAERIRRVVYNKLLRSQNVLHRTDLNNLSLVAREEWERGMIIGARSITAVKKIERGEVPIFASVDNRPRVKASEIKKRPKKDIAALLLDD